MKIEDSNLFTVLVPTFESTHFLKRALDYFRSISFKGRIVLADNSSGVHKVFVEKSGDEYLIYGSKRILFPKISVFWTRWSRRWRRSTRNL